MPIYFDLSKYKNDYFIETGSYNGEGIEKALQTEVFKYIYSIELDTLRYICCKERYSTYDNVTLIKGDSGKLLELVMKNINKPCTIFLDAHFCGDEAEYGSKWSPIVEELAIIKKHHIKNHTIIVDDYRCFDNTHFDKGRNIPVGFPGKKKLLEMLKDINQDYCISFLQGSVPNDAVLAKVDYPTICGNILNSIISKIEYDEKVIKLLGNMIPNIIDNSLQEVRKEEKEKYFINLEKRLKKWEIQLQEKEENQQPEEIKMFRSLNEPSAKKKNKKKKNLASQKARAAGANAKKAKKLQQQEEELLTQKKELQNKEEELNHRHEELDNRDKLLQKKEEELQKRGDELLQKKENELKKREEELDDRNKLLQKREEDLDKKKFRRNKNSMSKLDLELIQNKLNEQDELLQTKETELENKEADLLYKEETLKEIVIDMELQKEVAKIQKLEKKSNRSTRRGKYKRKTR